MDNPQRGSDFVPGAVGPFADDVPPVHQANIRPYVIAVLLHRHTVSLSDLVGCVQPFCPASDSKLSSGSCEDPDLTRLECLCLDVLDEMWKEGVLRYNVNQKTWSLTASKLTNLSTYIHWASATGGMISKETLYLF